MDAGLEDVDLAGHQVLVVDVAALRLDRAVHYGGHDLLALAAGIADVRALRAALPRPECEPLHCESGHVEDGHVTLGIEKHDRRAHRRAVWFLDRVRRRPGHDMRVGPDVSVADWKAASGDDATTTQARHLDHRLRGAVDAWRIDGPGNRERAWQRRLEAGEDRRKLNARQDLLHAREKRRRARCEGVQAAQQRGALDLLSDLRTRAAREAEAEEPAHHEHRECGERGARDGIGRGVDASAQDLAANRLAAGGTEAPAKAA